MKKSRPWVSLAAEIDSSLARSDHVEALQQYEGEWIRATRLALGWVIADLARKLEWVAKAMNCRFVYGFIPNESLADVATDLYERQQDARRRKRRMPRPS